MMNSKNILFERIDNMANSKNVEKYSAKDLCDAFKVSDNCDIKNVLQKIKGDKAVKYFIGKKKSDTGDFLQDVITCLSEYLNIKTVSSHGFISLDDTEKMIKYIKGWRVNELFLISHYLKYNKLLSGKKISLISSLRNKEFKKTMENFFEVVLKIQLTSIQVTERELFIKSIALLLDTACKALNVPAYIHPEQGIDYYIVNGRYSADRVCTELKCVFKPINDLKERISKFLNSKAIKSSHYFIDYFTDMIFKRYVIVDSSVIPPFRAGEIILKYISNYLECIYDEAIKSDRIKEIIETCCPLSTSDQKTVRRKINKNLRVETALHYRSNFLKTYEDNLYSYIAPLLFSQLIWKALNEAFPTLPKLSTIFDNSGICKILTTKLKEIFDIRFKSYLDQLAKCMAAKQIEIQRKANKAAKKEQKEQKKKLPGPISFKHSKKFRDE